MARKLAINDKSVAYAVIEDLLSEDALSYAWDNQDANGVADHLLKAAEIEYQPRARKLILTFDLSGEPPAPPYVDDEPVPYVPTDVDKADTP